MKTAIILLLGVACSFAATTQELSWRIVGGQAAKEGQFPHQISLTSYGSHSCGGSIIDATTILCAAHCVVGASPDYMTVVTGSTKLNAGGTSYKVKSITYHEGFNPNNLQNDVSIIKLSEPIQFNENVQPIVLNEANIGEGEDVVLSGWGTTSYPGDIPNDLQFINLKTSNLEACKKAQSPIEVIDSEICTLTKKGEGACHGDSGGPLISKATGQQVGIVSWGRPCALGLPDVFTRVSSFISWINKNK